MDSTTLPGQRKRPMSYAEASRGANNVESANTPDPRRRSMSHADATKEKQIVTSPEPPGPSWPLLPFTDEPCKEQHGTELSTTPAQVGPSTSHVEGKAHKASPQLDADDTSRVAHKMVSLKKSPTQKKLAMSYADVARKNVPVQKKPATKQAPGVDQKQATQQASGVDKPKPAMTTIPTIASQRGSSTPDLLLAIENVLKSTEPSHEPAAPPPPPHVPEREHQNRDKLPETATGLAQQTATTTALPGKNRSLTWADVVKGQRALVLPPSTPRSQYVTPLLPTATPLVQPATPHIQPDTPLVDEHDSPAKSTKSGKSRKTPPKQKAKENSRPQTPGSQEPGYVFNIPDSTQSETSKKKPQTPGQPGKHKKTKSKQSPSKGGVRTTAQPETDEILSLSDVEQNPKLAPFTDRTVPIYPSGNLAATLKKKHEAEFANRLQAHTSVVNLPPSSTPWSSLGNPAASSTVNQGGKHTRQQSAAFDPIAFSPLNTSSPALPTIPATMKIIRNVDTSRVEDDNIRGRSPTAEAHINPPLTAPIDQPTTSATDDRHIKQERERSAMRRGITKTNANLWQFQFGWDVLVRCDAVCWRVHRHILEAESPWFAKRLPPQDPMSQHVEFNCDGHETNALGHALWFMYHGSYENSTFTPNAVLDGECIRKNVYMYLCGASVDCTSMMTFATSAVDQITAVLTDLMPAIYKNAGLYRLYIPLRQGLELLHSQGNRPNMFAMRVAMARLVDVTLLYFRENEAFRYAYEQYWRNGIYDMCYLDSVCFTRMGLIGGPDEDEAAVADESDEGTVVGEVDRGEVEEDEDATPRAEKKQKEAEPRGESGEQREGERQRDSEETNPLMDTPSRHLSATEESSAGSTDETASQETERA